MLGGFLGGLANLGTAYGGYLGAQQQQLYNQYLRQQQQNAQQQQDALTLLGQGFGQLRNLPTATAQPSTDTTTPTPSPLQPITPQAPQQQPASPLLTAAAGPLGPEVAGGLTGGGPLGLPGLPPMSGFGGGAPAAQELPSLGGLGASPAGGPGLPGFGGGGTLAPTGAPQQRASLPGVPGATEGLGQYSPLPDYQIAQVDTQTAGNGFSRYDEPIPSGLAGLGPQPGWQGPIQVGTSTLSPQPGAPRLQGLGGSQMPSQIPAGGPGIVQPTGGFGLGGYTPTPAPGQRQPDASTADTGQITPQLAGSNVDWRDESPVFRQRVSAMLAAAPPEVRDAAVVESARRTQEQQAEIYARSGRGTKFMAAPPGESWHERGGAADWTFKTPAAEQWVKANAGRFGLSFPLGSRDPNHMQMSDQPVSGRAQAVEAAHRSLDNDVDQTGANMIRTGTASGPTVQDSTKTAMLAGRMIDPSQWGRVALTTAVQAIEKANPSAPDAVKALAIMQLYKLLAPEDKMGFQYMMQQNREIFQQELQNQRQQEQNWRTEFTADVRERIAAAGQSGQDRRLAERERQINQRHAESLAERQRQFDARTNAASGKLTGEESAQLRRLKAQQVAMNNQAARYGGWVGAPDELRTARDTVDQEIDDLLSGVEKRTGAPQTKPLKETPTKPPEAPPDEPGSATATIPPR